MNGIKLQIAVTKAVSDIMDEAIFEKHAPEYYAARKNLIKSFISNRDSRGQVLQTFERFIEADAHKNNIDLENSDQIVFDDLAKKLINKVSGITQSQLPSYESFTDYEYPITNDSDGNTRKVSVISWFNDLINKRLILTFGVRSFDGLNGQLFDKYKVVKLYAENAVDAENNPILLDVIIEFNPLAQAVGLPQVTQSELDGWGKGNSFGEYDLYTLLESTKKYNIPELYALGVALSSVKGNFDS